MAQGKLKVKSKVPQNVAAKNKKKQQLNSAKKGKIQKKSKKNNAGAQLTKKFNKEIKKKIDANIVSELASVAQRVEEGKSFLTLSTELGSKKKK